MEAPDGFYEACGFRVIGNRAVRIDMLEKVAEAARKKLAAGALKAESDMMSFVGCSGDDFTAILRALGYGPKPDPENDAETVYIRDRRGAQKRKGKHGKPGKRPHKEQSKQKARKEAARMADSPFAELATLKAAMRPQQP